MTWTANESSTLYTGPYLVGTGAAGSEQSFGEVDALLVRFGYIMEDHMGGAFLGVETIYDQIPKGIRASATCRFKQVFNTTLLDKWCALADLSAGSTSKSLTFDPDSIIGKSMRANAARIRFHKYSVSDLTDETQDIIFPLGIAYPIEDDIDLMASAEGVTIPIFIQAFPTTSTNEIIVIGKNA